MNGSELTPEQQAIRENVSASHLLDPVRLKLSYTEHTATALRRRALAAANGRNVLASR